MRFNFRKIASVIASAVMLGSTAGIAMAANYPAPFVVGGASDAAIVVTAGTHAGATSDWAAATSLQGNLQTKVTTTTSTSTPTITGEAAALFTGGTKIYINDSINAVKNVLTKTDLPTVLNSGSFSGNVETTYTQTIQLGSTPSAAQGAAGSGGNFLVYAKQPTSSNDPTFGISMSTTSSNYLYNVSISFNKVVNFTSTDSKNQQIELMGKKFTIGSGTTNADLVLFKEATTIDLDSSGTTSQEVTVGGKKYTVEMISASVSSATIKVTNEAGTTEQKEINEGYSKKINGLTLAVQTADSNNLKYTASVVAGAEKYTLTTGSSVTYGDTGTPIDGTKVTFMNGSGAGSPVALDSIKISVVAKDSDNSAIMPEKSFVDPVFGTFKIDLNGLNIPETNTSSRETFKIYSAGDDKVLIDLTDSGGNSKTGLQWAYNSSGIGLKADSSGRNIIVGEMIASNRSEYIVVGNEDEGKLIKVTRIYNSSSSSYSDDKIEFQDVFSSESYPSSITAEGTGSVTIGGKVFTVTYLGGADATEDARTVQLKYPDSGGASTMIIYPVISTSMGAKIGFYKPLAINVTNWDGAGTDLTIIKVPNGARGYQSIAITMPGLAGVGIDGTEINATAATSSKSVTLTGTNLNLNFTYTAANLTTVYLTGFALGAKSGNIVDPAVFFYEPKDDNNNYNGVITTLIGSGTKTGVNTVYRTWANDNVWNSITLASDSKKTKEADLWGTIVTIDSSDSAQKTASFSFPKEQIYANVYGAAVAAEIGGGGTTTGGSILVVKDNEVDSVKDKNLIVVGGSCINSAAAKILGSVTPICGAEFTTKAGVSAGQYIIKSVASPYNTAKTAILVAGYEATDTSTAVAKLQDVTTVTDVGTSKVYPETVTTA